MGRRGQAAGTPASGRRRCPRCGVALVARGGSHACGDHTVERFLAGASPTSRGLYQRFVALIAACGPYEVAPARTRVAFLAQVRFASVNRVGTAAIDVHFVLPRALTSPRFLRVEHLGALHVHHLRLTRAEDFDAELAGWLAASYREYGQRTWLARHAERAAATDQARRSGARAAPRSRRATGAPAGRRRAAPRTRRAAEAPPRSR